MLLKFHFVSVFFTSKRFGMIPESLLKCSCNVMHNVFRVLCCDSCLVDHVILHAFPIKWAFPIASAVATVCVLILWLVLLDDV